MLAFLILFLQPGIPEGPFQGVHREIQGVHRGSTAQLPLFFSLKEKRNYANWIGLNAKVNRKSLKIGLEPDCSICFVFN